MAFTLGECHLFCLCLVQALDFITDIDFFVLGYLKRALNLIDLGFF